MSAHNLIVKTLLEYPAIAALIGNRKAQAQLPQGCAMPALVYNFISSVPMPFLNYTNAEPISIRVQFNPVAKTMAAVDQIHDAIKGVFEFVHQQTIAGKFVVIITREPSSPLATRDADTGLWSSNQDYLIIYIE